MEHNVKSRNTPTQIHLINQLILTKREKQLNVVGIILSVSCAEAIGHLDIHRQKNNKRTLI